MDINGSLPQNQFSEKLSVPLPMIPEPKAKTNKKVLIFLLVLFLLVGTVAYGAYYKIYQANPDRIFLAAVENFINNQSGTIRSNIDVSITPNKDNLPPAAEIVSVPDEIKASLRLNTNFAKADGFEKSDTLLSFNFDSAGEIVPGLNLDTLQPEVNFRVVGPNDLFVKINGLETLTMFNLNRLNDQWLHANLELTSSFLESGIYSLGGNGENSQLIAKALEIYKKNSFLVLKNMGTEIVNNEKAWHFSMALDKDILAQYVLSLDEAAQEEGLESKVHSIDEVKKEFANVEFNGEIYISKSTNQFAKLVTNINVNHEDGRLVTTISGEYLNANKPINIVTPDDYISVEEAAGFLMSPSSDSYPTDLDAASFEGIDSSDLDLYNIDSDGDGYSDGEELDNGYNPYGEGLL